MKAVLCSMLAAACYVSAYHIEKQPYPPTSWAVISSCIWLLYAVLSAAGLNTQQRVSMMRSVLWGVACSCMFLGFLAHDPGFKSWGDVYFFCGTRMQYCTCGFRWNAWGWYKAAVLWSFTLSTALGLQRLVIQLGLQGLLPGEEVVTRESFISICWRLIPYWLNNWEQQWGAECSSMMFELPHFAVELLIILPCVQILCSRMKVLVVPSINAPLAPDQDEAPEVVRQQYVPNVLRGCWERRPEQKHILQRVRANKRIIAFSCFLCALAGFNALVIPLSLEDLILSHPDAAVMQVAGRLPPWSSIQQLSDIQTQLLDGRIQLNRSFVVDQAAAAAASAAVRHALKRSGNPAAYSVTGDLVYNKDAGAGAASNSTLPAQAVAAAAAAEARVLSLLAAAETGPWQHNSSWCAAAVDKMMSRAAAFQAPGHDCIDLDRLRSNLHKHHQEMFRMQDPQHRGTIPLVEIALALMRLSTEKYFVLLSLYVAFILFRTPPRHAAALVAFNARVSGAFARLILYTFPAVCWVYGAGFIFSTFVSVLFWGGPVMQLYEFLRTSTCSVSIKDLRPATAAEVERMHGDCAICWCEMTVRGRQGGSTADTGMIIAADGDGGGRSSTMDAPGAVQPGGQSSVVLAGLGAGGPHGAELAAAPASEAAQAVAAAAAVAEALDHAAEALPAGSSVGFSLPCRHAYHQACLNQWLQQCYSQGVTATCPMCQVPMQLDVRWHLLGPRAPAAAAGGGDAAVRGGGFGAADVGDPGAVQAQAANNYLLDHQPRLVELLADMPQLLVHENVQLLAEVQDLRHQRQQLVEELQLRQQQLQELAGRQQQLELEGMEMEQQRQQLMQELQLLRRARDRQRQLRQILRQQQQPQGPGDQDVQQRWDWEHLQQQGQQQGQQQPAQQAAGVQVEAGNNAADAGERLRQLEMLLDTFIQEQEAAVRRAAASSANHSSSTTSSSSRSADVNAAGKSGATRGVGNPAHARSRSFLSYHREVFGEASCTPAPALSPVAAAPQEATAGSVVHLTPTDNASASADLLSQSSNLLRIVDAAACPQHHAQQVHVEQQQQLDDQGTDEQQRPAALLRRRWRHQ